jgi:hypothetical protein
LEVGDKIVGKKKDLVDDDESESDETTENQYRPEYDFNIRGAKGKVSKIEKLLFHKKWLI